LKKCTRCKKTKPFEYFFKDKYSNTGYYAKCKKCAKERKKELKKRGYTPKRKLGACYMKDQSSGRHLHCVIWEKHHKKKIPKGYHIHHINGNKRDNRIQNLQCCSPAEHIRIHTPSYHKINGTWVKYCKICENILPLNKFRHSKTKIRPFCRECERLLERRKYAKEIILPPRYQSSTGG
jgi:hypothetical protein